MALKYRTAVFLLMGFFLTSTLQGRVILPSPLTTYQLRRGELLEKVGKTSAVLLYGGAFTGSSHMDLQRFRQDSNFYYLTGVSQKKGALVLFWEKDQPIERLYLPVMPPWVAKWVGKRLTPGKEGTRETGIQQVLPLSQLSGNIEKLQKRGIKTLYTNCQENNPSFYPKLLKIAKKYSAKIDSPSSLLAEMRVIKDSLEMNKIQRAIDITLEAHRRAMKRARPGMWEFQLQAEIEYIFLREGAVRPAFTSIVGSGPNSCILHYSANRRKMEAGDLVVVDIGAEFERYVADVTRTIPVSGKFTPRQKEIYNIVLGAQEAAFKAIKPGVFLRDVHKAAAEYIKQKGYGKYFLHGTSHWMGLDVHDLGPYNVRLKPGMVFTVEPGIYIAKEKMGIRIEDDVVVTKRGYRILSGALPRKAEEIEKMMAK